MDLGIGVGGAGSIPVVVCVVAVIVFFTILDVIISHLISGEFARIRKIARELLMGITTNVLYDMVTRLSAAGGFCTSS